MTQMKPGILPLAGVAGVILAIGSFIFANSAFAPFARLFALTRAVDHGRHISPDITQFGYGPLNSASTVSGFDSRSSFRLSLLTLPGADKAMRFMPLLVDRMLIYGTKDNGLTAQDIDRGNILWTVHLPAGLAGAPAIARANNKIYFYTRGYAANGGFVHFLHQLNLDGTDLKSWPIDLASIYASRGLESQGFWNNRIHCKTAMALQESADGNGLYVGCSIATEPGQNKRYGDTMGLTGLILHFRADRDGNLGSGVIYNWFETSRLTGKSGQGFDTGIYSIGSKPAILPDSSLIAATGNGPVAFADGNYGCSVISIGPDMKVSRGFSRFGESSQECWSSNVEYANSGVALTRLGTEFIGAVISKDGMATLFNPATMNAQKNFVVEDAVGGMPSFGQPAVWNMAGDKARFFFQAHKSRRNDSNGQEDLLVTEEQLSQFPNPGTKSCFGYVSSVPSSKRLSLLYSGSLRDEYKVLVNPSETYRQLTSVFSERFGDDGQGWFTKTLWAPYQWISDLGYLFEHPAQIPQQMAFEPWDGEGTLGLFKPRQSGEHCPDVGDERLQALYELTYVRDNPVFEEDAIVAIDINTRLEHSVAWRYPLKATEQLFKSHPMVSTDASGRNPVVIVPIATSQDGQVPEAALLFLDGSTGRELYRQLFQGQVAYSMPVVFDDYVIVSTTNDGLKVFELQPQASPQTIEEPGGK